MSDTNYEHQDRDVSEAPRASSSELTDQEIVDRIRGGDEVAFTVLYDRYFQRIYSFAYLRLRSHADAEEVVQETFLAAFHSIDAFQGTASLLSWVYGIAKNTVNNHIRRTKSHEARIERAEVSLRLAANAGAVATPEENVAYQRCTEAVQDSLASLAPWHVEIFALRHLENLSIGEISKRMSRSNDAVRSSLYRVKRLIVDAAMAPGDLGQAQWGEMD
ncbi:RNA polymerase sigma factor [Myxococcota bacterium]|nr:RNA polymerase sigma factor [Myxococcota bacterium]